MRVLINNFSAISLLVMPLAIPLIAGPGAIVTTVTISTANDGAGMTPALIAVAVLAVVVFVSFQWLGGLLAKLSPSTTALLMRIGGDLSSKRWNPAAWPTFAAARADCS